MTVTPQYVLIVAVAAVGVLHTLVPDHWLPIALMSRQLAWSRRRTARAAFIAGLGHTLSTLAIGAVVWIAGVALAVRAGHIVSIVSSVALIGFGLWIAISSLREIRSADTRDMAREQLTQHPKAQTRLLLILGSSPMVEGIPAFFAAGKFGVGLLAIMAAVFAVSTIATYILLCVYSGAAMQRVRLGRLEQYGETISGAIIAVVGIVFLICPFS